jgi:hypothetical protein
MRAPTAVLIDETRWNNAASRLLKGELVTRGVSYAQLAQRLTQTGLRETQASIANKLSRGTFTLAFFLSCMEALDVEQISLTTVLGELRLGRSSS